MPFEDRLLKCSNCSEEFIFSASEQFVFSKKGFVNVPKTCPLCRRSPSKAIKQTSVICAGCGEQAIVPFKPTQGRPVLCSRCFYEQRSAPELL